MWWLVSCFEPTVSGTNGLVGRVLGPLDVPVEGLVVESLEARGVTDHDGRFAVQYKAPDQHVSFSWRGTVYRRVYREEDAGQEVRVVLPGLRDLPVRCDVDAACRLAVGWALGEGLSGTATFDCAPGVEGLMPGVPAGPAESAQCGGQTVMVGDAGVVVSPAAKRTPITVAGGGASCVVSVEGGMAEGAGPSWSAMLVRPTVAMADCDGVPALPAVVRPGEPAALIWQAKTPRLDLTGVLPDAARAWLLADGEGSWLTPLPRQGAVFVLPPIGPGVYRVAASRDGSPPEALVLALVEGPVPDAPGAGLVLGEIEGGVVGTLRVEGAPRELYAPGS